MSLGGLDSQGSVRHPADLGGVGQQGNVAKLQEVLELTVWFPVGQTPGSLEGRAVQAKWALLPSPAESQRIFLCPPHPPTLPHAQRFGKSCHRVEWKA